MMILSRVGGRLALIVVVAVCGTDEGPRLSVAPSSRRCAYDTVRASWSVRGQDLSSAAIWLVMDDHVEIGATPSPLSRIPLPAYVDSNDTVEAPRVLYDELAGPSTPPNVLQMVWRQEEWKLSIEFERATSTPSLNTAEQIEAVLHLRPALSAASSYWDDEGRWLVIHVNLPEDAARLGEAFASRSFTATLAPWPPVVVPETVSGEEVFRLGLPGDFKLCLVVDSVVVAVTEDIVRIENCQEERVLHDFAVAVKSSPEIETILEPWFEAAGVLATMTGEASLQIPSAELPGGGRGDFALSMWLFLGEDFTGLHRALFFKGDVDLSGGHRTPSAWLLPDSNRLALRVSTVEAVDVGAETESALPINKWTHLCFSFKNESEHHYELSYVVDGLHDSTLTFNVPVQANDGPLHIGRDPERTGPKRSMLADVKVWPRALTHREAADEFARTSKHRHIPSQCVAESGVRLELAKESLAEAEAATAACEPYSRRLELYEASSSSLAKRRAVELILYGAERLVKGPNFCKSDRVPSLDVAGIKRAMGYLEQAAGDDPQAARELALLRLTGIISAETTTEMGSELTAETTTTQVAVEEQSMLLLFQAAGEGDARAALSLSRRYKRGLLVGSVEAASWYARSAASTAYSEYHTPGEQTHMVFERLSDIRKEEAPKRQRGDEDAELQAQVLRAEAGDVPALVATGDLFYWGARGFARDQVRARRYFQRAANEGNVEARSLFATMLLRGEGGEVDHAEAVRQWEIAAQAGSSKALNGLGYEYFTGGPVEKNLTKAYGYFAEAARLGSDGDSVFNAAHCLDNGLGVARDVTKAAELYERAARHFGHFDAAWNLAQIRAEGRGGAQRDPAVAQRYFESCALAGWAARDLRAGFDRYLAGDEPRALLWYAQAAEAGFSHVAAANAAWLLDRSTALKPFVDTRAVALKYHHVAFEEDDSGEAAAAIGDATRDDMARLSWYSKAAKRGSARATLAMAHLHSRGSMEIPRHRARARRLYKEALRQETSTQMQVAVYVGLAKITADEWLDSAPPRENVLFFILLVILLICLAAAAIHRR